MFKTLIHTLHLCREQRPNTKYNSKRRCLGACMMLGLIELQTHVCGLIWPLKWHLLQTDYKILSLSASWWLLIQWIKLEASPNQSRRHAHQKTKTLTHIMGNLKFLAVDIFWSLERVCGKYLFDPVMKKIARLDAQICWRTASSSHIFFTPCKLIFYLNATVLFDYLMRFSGKKQPRVYCLS